MILIVTFHSDSRQFGKWASSGFRIGVESENIKLINNFSKALLMSVFWFSKSSQFQKLQLLQFLVLTLEQLASFFPLLSFSDQNIHFDTIAFFPRIEKYLVYFGVYALKMFYLAMAENIPVTPRF